MEFNGDEGKKIWEDIVSKNQDWYGEGIVRYARYWAKLMQVLILEGKKVADIAEQTSHEADIMGLSGFAYGCAVSALVSCWKYGEELRIWHNSKYSYDGDGTVNPAVLTL